MLAGVMRAGIFSKAGSMHHDLKGSMADGSLEHSLIALANRPLTLSEWGGVYSEYLTVGPSR